MTVAQDTRIGSRIRARRLAHGRKQADLARVVGISASYLNLIEHNRRRIGGALLVRMARALDVSPELLSKGAEAALIDQLTAAALAADAAEPELDRLEDFTQRFPGWAALVAEQAARIGTLDRALARLSERVSHDPHLASSLHDLLSTITSIRSTAAILAKTGDITPEWRARFDRNIYEDSRRLSESSRALVAYLDAAADSDIDLTLTPEDEVAQVFRSADHHISALEQGAEVRDVLDALAPDLSAAATDLAIKELARYRRDALILPLDRLAGPLARHGLNPVMLLADLDVEAAVLLRRLAHLPAGVLQEPVGLVICDAAGALVHRRDLADFALPRYDAVCVHWPVFEALNRPGTPLLRDVITAERDELVFRTYSVAGPAEPPQFGVPTRMEAVMLIHRHPGSREPGAARLGPATRLCPLGSCTARRSATGAALAAQEF